MSQEEKKLKIASLFAGCGGLDLGFSGGFSFLGKFFASLPTEVVFANDFDSDAVTCYNENMKKYHNSAICLEKDVRDIEVSQIPDFDILLAGFPCQPFSNAGLRGGVNDKYNRGTLFEECMRIVKGKIERGNKPKAFVFENVRGIMSSKMDNGTPVIEEIERRMSELGYISSHKLIKASDYGVPQNRYRLLIIGVDSRYEKFDFAEMDQVVESENLPSVAHNRPERLLLGHLLHDLNNYSEPNDACWEYTQATQKMIEQIGPCEHGIEGFDFFEEGYKVSDLPDIVSRGRSWKNIPPEDLTPRFRRIYDNPKKYHAPNFFRRFAFGEINGTITASAQPENCGITHPIFNRRYTVREIARIQSFPDSFTFDNIQLQSRYKVIGNAVPPVMGWVIASALIKHVLGGK